MFLIVSNTTIVIDSSCYRCFSYPLFLLGLSIIIGLIKSRGKELLPRIPSLMAGLLKAMETITNDQAMNGKLANNTESIEYLTDYSSLQSYLGTLHAVRSLSIHHEIPVIDQLLKANIPHSQ